MLWRKSNIIEKKAQTKKTDEKEKTILHQH